MSSKLYGKLEKKINICSSRVEDAKKLFNMTTIHFNLENVYRTHPSF